MVGVRFGNYVVVKFLGEGGMGVVYLAKHPALGRNAAVKVLKADRALQPAAVTRFFNEARAANAVGHSGIVQVFDYGFAGDGSPYLLMEALEGESVASLVRRLRKLPAGVAVEIALQTASAMEAAHRAGIIHRDLKPENLFLVQGESRPQVKVLDFGIAKLKVAGDAPSASLTASGVAMGTPAYMSPEQCRGTGEVDHRADIYALGAILFEMLTGRPPFVSTGFGELLYLHISQPAPPVKWLTPEVSDVLEHVVARMLEKDPDARFATMEEVARELRSVLTDASSPRLLAPAGHTNAVLAQSPTLPLPTVVPSDTPTQSTERPAQSARVAQPTQKRHRSLAYAAALLLLGPLVLWLSWRDAVETNEAAPEEAAVPEGNDASEIASVEGRVLEPDPLVSPALATGRTQRETSQSSVDGGLGSDPATADTVHVHISSQPIGATVREADSLRTLGRTPLDLMRPRGSGTLRVRLSLRGHESVLTELDLDRDREIVASLPPMVSGSSEVARPRLPAGDRPVDVMTAPPAAAVPATPPASAPSVPSLDASTGRRAPKI